MTFDAKQAEDSEDIMVLLPEPDELDGRPWTRLLKNLAKYFLAVLGTSKWMVRQADSEALGRGSSGRVEIVGPVRLQFTFNCLSSHIMYTGRRRCESRAGGWRRVGGKRRQTFVVEVSCDCHASALLIL